MRQALFIDDDTHECQWLQHTMRAQTDEAVSFRSVTTVEAAQEALAAERFDLVLLDNRVPPYRNFHESLPKLQKHLHGAAVYVVSSYTDTDEFKSADPAAVRGVYEKADLPRAFLEGAI